MNRSQRSESKLFYGWWVVFASIVGMIVSQGPVLVFTFGIFMKPLAAEFGWTRSQISLALTLAILSAAIFTPWVGRLIDRRGSRQVAIPALILFGLGVATLALLPPNLWIFYLWFCAIGVLSAGGAPTAYAKAISHWFVRRRGLALGVSMAGIGLGAALMPIIAQNAVSAVGWRGGFAVIGAVVLIGMLLVAWKLRNSPSDLGLHPDNEAPHDGRVRAAAVGLTCRQAIRTKNFWLIAVAFFLAALAINGCSVHFVPLLTDRGVSPEDAAKTASVIGIALIVGRVGAGYLLDYVFAPFVALFFFSGPVIGILLLYGGATGTEAVLCAALIGLGVGAEVDLIAYLASRYFGLKAFGEVYGYQFAIFCVGTAFGPLLMGTGQTIFGSYDLVLLFFVGCMVVACLLMCCVGRYPDLIEPEDNTAQGRVGASPAHP
ncbi:MFS transporter [Stutzerimonas frequens]|uniref:MFS transporter n=1 Tax=Stutzerimonas frequens TaxID=2968969 RepID=UPI000D7DD81A|nr:MFS transporter [Stutzerimonas frequens]AWT11882.1 MFS transporter [Stutzerimonas frequens]